jgi:predicted nucleic acid-binding protein
LKKVYVLDACALIAALSNEKGAEKVESAYDEAVSGEAEIVVNIINLLEVYYDEYRIRGAESADEMIGAIMESPTKIISEIERNVFAEAGRLKASYKISLADSILLAQTKIVDGTLLTSDHHELDIIEAKEPIKFLWIR